jgi:hypothetical protein
LTGTVARKTLLHQPMATADRLVEYAFTAVLVVVVCVLVWRHQNKPEPGENSDKKRNP